MRWTTHRQVRITAPPWMTCKRIAVDEEMAPLLRQLWRRCFVTVASCQESRGHFEGLAHIVFEQPDMAREFARLARGPADWPYEPPDLWWDCRKAFGLDGGTESLEEAFRLLIEWASRDKPFFQADGWAFADHGDPRCTPLPYVSAYFPREILAKVREAEAAGRGIRSYASARAAWAAAMAEAG